ncbi:MAG: ATP-binding cassette domain-containing protein, partial [Chloroflexota bacterium]
AQLHPESKYINLTNQEGEVFGLAGLEGSGQELFLRTLAGLSEFHAGEIIIDGDSASGISYHTRMARGIEFISSGRLEEGLVRGLTLTEHMVLSALEKPFFIDWESITELTSQRIEQFQVIGSPTLTADALSGGNQQRLLFAMLNAPLKVLLLDKPTRGLDVRSTSWMWDELNKWRRDGATILFISEDLDEIVARSDRIGVFFGGEMIKIIEAELTTEKELGHLIGGEII